MIIEKLKTPEKIQEECVIVIDVLRAFTTAAYAFAAGADKIIPVATVDEAFNLRKEYKDALLMGELDGKPIAGFDFGNSPTEIKKEDLTGRTLIQRTSSGTQGVVRSLTSKKILVGSFSVAEATLKRILNLNPDKATFIVTGRTDGDEDLAFAEYLEAKIKQKKEIDPTPFLERVKNSFDGKYYASNAVHSADYQDLIHATAIDEFHFAMQLFHNGSHPVIYPVNEFGITLCLANEKWTHSKIAKT